jgi:hypothetical protein
VTTGGLGHISLVPANHLYFIPLVVLS